jgi:hypothetical protein
LNYQEKILCTATIILAIINLLSPFLPWFKFSAFIIHVLVEEPYPVSGVIYGFGTGRLDLWGAEVTIWSNDEIFTTRGSDFWYGVLPLMSGLILLTLGISYGKIQKVWIKIFLVLLAITLSVSGFLSAILYEPALLTIMGQIDDLLTDVDFIYRDEFKVRLGIGPFVCLISGILSSLFFIVILIIKNKTNP